MCWAATSSALGRSSAWAASPPRCSAWRTPACTTAADSADSGQESSLARFRSGRGVSAALIGWSQVDAQGEDSVSQFDLGVADHGVVGEVLLSLLAEPLPFG